LYDFIHKFDIELDIIFFNIKSVDNRIECLIEIIEGVIIKLTVDRVHLRDFEVDDFDKVVSIRCLGEDSLFACL